MSTFDKVYIDKVDFEISEFRPRMKGVLPTVNAKQMDMDEFKMLRDYYLADPNDIRRAAPFVDILNAIIMGGVHLDNYGSEVHRTKVDSLRILHSIVEKYEDDYIAGPFTCLMEAQDLMVIGSYDGAISYYKKAYEQIKNDNSDLYGVYKDKILTRILFNVVAIYLVFGCYDKIEDINNKYGTDYHLSDDGSESFDVDWMVIKSYLPTSKMDSVYKDVFVGSPKVLARNFIEKRDKIILEGGKTVIITGLIGLSENKVISVSGYTPESFGLMKGMLSNT